MNDIIELATIQRGSELVSRRRLLELANERGAQISERQLTTLISERIFPGALRLGAGEGEYPVICVDLLFFIGVLKQASATYDALRDLMPLWRYTERCRRAGALDLDEFEDVVSKCIKRPSSAFWVPWVLGGLLYEDDISVRRSGESVDNVTFSVRSGDWRLGEWMLSASDAREAFTITLLAKALSR